jgi:thioredoxin-related protein
MKRVLFSGVLLFTVSVTLAQDVTGFTLTNVMNGKKVSLSTYPSCAGLVIIFTSNECAYDAYYRERIVKISNEHQDKIPVLLVNSSIEPKETTEHMVRKGKELGLAIPYLEDKDQVLMQQLGATKSPQAFLLKNNGGKFSVVFNGAIDDNPQVAADVRRAYLKDAMDIMLTNQKIETPLVRPVGCALRKK